MIPLALMAELFASPFLTGWIADREDADEGTTPLRALRIEPLLEALTFRAATALALLVPLFFVVDPLTAVDWRPFKPEVDPRAADFGPLDAEDTVPLAAARVLGALDEEVKGDLDVEGDVPGAD